MPASKLISTFIRVARQNNTQKNVFRSENIAFEKSILKSLFWNVPVSQPAVTNAGNTLKEGKYQLVEIYELQ